MSNTTIRDLVPVGSVLAYAAKDTTQLDVAGWLVCDGRVLSVAKYHELWEAIRFANGGDGTSVFNLPNYQGYFLRGVDQGAGNDPNADSRTAPASLGNPGDNPGSIQSYATASPASGSFKLAVKHLPDGNEKGNKGSLVGKEVAEWSGVSTKIKIEEGGDKESRPINRYVYFIIKSSAKTANGADVNVPVGAVVPFAGPNTSALGNQWLLCNGNKLDSAQNLALFKAIGIVHGGNGKPYFYLPDYQGYVLRGVSGPSRNDPDADNRTTPQPELAPGEQGASGDNVGSVEYWATAHPQSGFSISASHLPTDHHKIDDIAGRKASAWKEGPEVLKPPTSGGDSESRPTNAYVDWYIKAL